jgi:hypothetical protein
MLWVGYTLWNKNKLPLCPPVSEIMDEIRKDPAVLQCTDISVEIDRCVVRLQGRMESPEQLARLRGVVQSLRGITYINDTLVRIVEAPFCEVMDLLEPLQKHAETHDFGLKVRLVNKEGKKSPSAEKTSLSR